MESGKIVNSGISGSFGTARVEIRELTSRECVVTHSAQIRVGTTGSLILRLGGENLAVRASVMKSSLLAPSLEGMVYRTILRIDAGDGVRMRSLIPSLSASQEESLGG
jgi:hypothetical protein